MLATMYIALIDKLFPIVSGEQVTEARNEAIAATVFFLLMVAFAVYRLATRDRNPYDDGSDRDGEA